MNGPTHMLVGYAAGLAVLPGLAAARGDHWPIGVTAMVAAVPAVLAKLNDKDRSLGLRHRGVTHTLVFVGVCWALAKWAAVATGTWWLAPAALLGVGVGGLAPDCVTEAGCPLFWPLFKRNVRLPKLLALKTRSPATNTEKWLRIALGLWCASMIAAPVLGIARGTV